MAVGVVRVNTLIAVRAMRYAVFVDRLLGAAVFLVHFAILFPHEIVIVDDILKVIIVSYALVSEDGKN
ncbi:MAG: hypothetical protein ACI4JC_01230 [Faecalibacterium sp.]